MIYRIRLSVALLLFKLGKRIHPDIASLQKEIDKAKKDLEQSMNIFGVPRISIEKCIDKVQQ